MGKKLGMKNCLAVTYLRVKKEELGMKECLAVTYLRAKKSNEV